MTWILCIDVANDTHVKQHFTTIVMQCVGLLAVLGALCAVAMAAEDKPDVGTVIGIDLGTTYSWFVIVRARDSLWW